MKLTILIVTSVAALTGAGAASSAAAEPEPGSFAEVYNLIRANLTGVTTAELDRAARQGLLNEFQSQVSLLPKTAISEITGTELLSKTNLFDDTYAYLRVARVEPGLAELLRSSYEKVGADKRLKGLVLDLRFARGQDYATAVKVADRFVDTEKPQLTLAGAQLRSTTKTDAWTIPVVVLMNRQTSGAAEALAALLRYDHVGLLLGTATAGEARLFKEFVLGDGQRLRIATGVVGLGESETLPAKGVLPDIPVEVSLAEERAYLADAYREPLRGAGFESGSTGTNALPRRRLNEAELVRRQREGLNPDDDSSASKARVNELAKPVVRDPALARALDLLKGLAVVNGNRAR